MILAIQTLMTVASIIGFFAGLVKMAEEKSSHPGSVIIIALIHMGVHIWLMWTYPLPAVIVFLSFYIFNKVADIGKASQVK